MTEVNDERRLHARHLTRLRVQLIRSDTLPFVVKTVELSRGGMHIETDRPTSQLLVPPEAAADQSHRPFTARIIPPPDDTSARTMTMQVEVVNMVPLDDDFFRIGLRFSCFFGKSRELLDQLIGSLSEDE